jgi:hypothetical protein
MFGFHHKKKKNSFMGAIGDELDLSSITNPWARFFVVAMMESRLDINFLKKVSSVVSQSGGAFTWNGVVLHSSWIYNKKSHAGYSNFLKSLVAPTNLLFKGVDLNKVKKDMGTDIFTKYPWNYKPDQTLAQWKNIQWNVGSTYQGAGFYMSRQNLFARMMNGEGGAAYTSILDGAKAAVRFWDEQVTSKMQGKLRELESANQLAMAQLVQERMKVESITNELKTAIINAKLKDTNTKAQFQLQVNQLKNDLANCKSQNAVYENEIKNLQKEIVDFKALLGDKAAQYEKDQATKKKLMIGGAIAAATAIFTIG